MMNPEVKAQWLEALRSGKYRQATGVLQRVNVANPQDPKGFCCLGVLCDISGKGRWEAPENDGRQAATFNVTGSDETATACLPTSVAQWAEFNDLVCVDIGGKIATLDSHNDTGASFEQIADAIEKYL